jgi:hypothetical protein
VLDIPTVAVMVIVWEISMIAIAMSFASISATAAVI